MDDESQHTLSADRILTYAGYLLYQQIWQTSSCIITSHSVQVHSYLVMFAYLSGPSVCVKEEGTFGSMLCDVAADEMPEGSQRTAAGKRGTQILIRLLPSSCEGNWCKGRSCSPLIVHHRNMQTLRFTVIKKNSCGFHSAWSLLKTSSIIFWLRTWRVIHKTTALLRQIISNHWFPLQSVHCTTDPHLNQR